MNDQHFIKQLNQAGVTFDAGLSEQELTEIEAFYDFRFPAEIRTFLKCAYPTADGFFPYRERTTENLARFLTFQEEIIEAFRFDFEENGLTVPGLDEGLSDEEYFSQLLLLLQKSPRLIPFYAHRCFFDGMDGMPIISFWQPTDCIIYGIDFADYLQVEFLEKELQDCDPEALLKNTGIWKYLIG